MKQRAADKKLEARIKQYEKEKDIKLSNTHDRHKPGSHQRR